MNAHVQAARAAIYLLPDECSSAWMRASPEWRDLIVKAAQVSGKVVDQTYEAMPVDVRVKIAGKIRALARLTAPILRGM